MGVCVYGGVRERLTSAGSSTDPCSSGRRDLVLQKQFQRQGKIVANIPVTAGACYTHSVLYIGDLHTHRHTYKIHTHIHTRMLALVLHSLLFHSVFLWGNCWFQTGSIKDETTFALVSLWCWETYLQPLLLVAACIDMHHTRCSVLAGKTTVRFSHASSLWTNRRTLASNHKTVWDMYI